MSKKKKNRYGKVQNGKLVINVNRIALDSVDRSVGFRTGRYLTEKDRPRKRYKPQDAYMDF